MAQDRDNLPTQAKAPSRSEVDAYFKKAMEVAKLQTNSARLIFALDATASRQPTWDMSSHLQAEMFQAAQGLNVQLVYFRGFDECTPSNWMTQPDRLAKLMEGITCRTGITQIGKVLAHAKREAERQKVQAMVFVGDAVEEDPDVLAHAGAELGRLGVPVFMFQEGDNEGVEEVYREIARHSRGAYHHFDSGSAQQLAELLRAVAVYASGGMKALAASHDAGAVKLLTAMKAKAADKKK